MLFIKIIAITVVTFFASSTVQDDSNKPFNIDITHSTALFKVHHVGAGMFYGRFNDVEGTIALGEENLPSFNVSISIDSVDTGNSKLDSHLKSPDFFNAIEFPTMTFKSTEVKPTDENTYEVSGEMTMHGVTKAITVEMVKTGQVTKRRGEMIGFETEFTINRSDFGMDYGVENKALSDQTKVIVALEAGRK